MRPPRRLVAAATALLCVFTIGAGVAVARLLPGRLALWQPARIASAPLADSGPDLSAATGAAGTSGSVTMAGLTTALASVLASPALGPQVGVLVTDLSDGQVLYSRDAGTGFTPASTTKIATAIAALQVLGPAARFHTTVVTGAASGDIVLVGGGDPTLAAGRPPSTDYPQPATLLDLASQTAQALRKRDVTSVQLGYDTSLYTGPGLAAAWSPAYVTTGNVTVITPLEVDQGRLTPSGQPQDADDPQNYSPRSADPAAQAAASFAGFLRADGITVQGTPSQVAAPAGATTLASVSSPPLSEIIQWMLEESNNVIAENLARHVALATGAQASFTGAAAAEEKVLSGLGVTGVQLNDGSGLSPDNLITPAALVQLISLAASEPRLRSALTGLPVYGFSGTLAPDGGTSFYSGGTAAPGMVRAKTGNLSTAAALAGVAYARDGQLLAFAVMADKLSNLASAEADMGALANVLAGCGCR
ncbi:MAG TPA: D-alanyl-D-alanine carboxypeptidase/D-alanyl-D-alanine-endopeptidase [Streptosporangiaceae bacterium]|nr:D-alanyl-D-alanine carboxypeptidase/D-alanyl-D-alanine-endopeptidase [Streptosporangiaceae bacterium]